METIIIASVIIALAGAVIWYYNRGAKSLDVNQDGKVNHQDVIDAAVTAARAAGQDLRDARDAALVASAESAMKAAGVIETAATKTKTAAKKVQTAAKKTAAKTAAKSRAKK